MQALYGFFKQEGASVEIHKKELVKGIDQVYDFYLLLLYIFIQLRNTELLIMEENKNKKLPTQQDLNPNLAFVENKLLVSISHVKEIVEQVEKKRLQNVVDQELLRKLLSEIKKTDFYVEYMALSVHSDKTDRDFLIKILLDVLNNHEVLLSQFEEKSIYWLDDRHIVFQGLIKNFEAFSGTFRLMPLMKDEKEDRAFVEELFVNCIRHKEENMELIQTHVKNWELERIAEMDMLLMQMCLTEIMHMSYIPVKASLNEYIDISKEYSTPNSRVFINGILDKAILQLRQENKIVKQGRGLKES